MANDITTAVSVVVPTIPSINTDAPLDLPVALSLSCFKPMEVIENKITDTHTTFLQDKEDIEEKAQSDDYGKALEVVDESSPCNCLACTTSTPMCKLRKDGCRHCYDLYASTSSHTRGTVIQTERGLHTNITTPPLTNTAITATISRQQCLFRCCIQESRMVKDLYVRELDRILSAAFTQKSMTNATFRTSSTSPMLLTDSTTPPTIESQSLPIGTEVLCCWHWNGVRIFGTSNNSIHPILTCSISLTSCASRVSFQLCLTASVLGFRSKIKTMHTNPLE